LLAHGHWFYPGTPASSNTKTGRHDIAEILLKVALKTINQSIKEEGFFCFSAAHLFMFQIRTCIFNVTFND
jgi:hypothetical protein